MDGEGGTGRGMNEANKGEGAGTVTEQGSQRDGAAGNREAETQRPWERGVSGGLGTGLLEAGRGRGPEVWESGAGVTPVTFRGLPGTSGETPTVREMQTKTQTGPRPLCLVWVPTVSVGGSAREEACLPPGLWGDSNWGDHGGEAWRALIGHPGTRGLEGRGLPGRPRLDPGERESRQGSVPEARESLWAEKAGVHCANSPGRIWLDRLCACPAEFHVGRRSTWPCFGRTYPEVRWLEPGRPQEPKSDLRSGGQLSKTSNGQQRAPQPRRWRWGVAGGGAGGLTRTEPTLPLSHLCKGPRCLYASSVHLLPTNLVSERAQSSGRRLGLSPRSHPNLRPHQALPQSLALEAGYPIGGVASPNVGAPGSGFTGTDAVGGRQLCDQEGRVSPGPEGTASPESGSKARVGAARVYFLPATCIIHTPGWGWKSTAPPRRDIPESAPCALCPPCPQPQKLGRSPVQSRQG